MSMPRPVLALPCGSRSIDERAVAEVGQRRPEVHGRRRLADAALLVGHGEDPRKWAGGIGSTVVIGRAERFAGRQGHRRHLLPGSLGRPEPGRARAAASYRSRSAAVTPWRVPRGTWGRGFVRNARHAGARRPRSTWNARLPAAGRRVRSPGDRLPNDRAGRSRSEERRPRPTARGKRSRAWRHQRERRVPRRSPTIVRPSQPARSASPPTVRAGGSLTTSCPPTRRNGAAHSATTPAGRSCGRPRRPRCPATPARAELLGPPAHHADPRRRGPAGRRRGASASVRRWLASSSTTSSSGRSTASTRPGSPPPLPRSSSARRGRSTARKPRACSMADVRSPEPRKPARAASRSTLSRALSSPPSGIRRKDDDPAERLLALRSGS